MDTPEPLIALCRDIYTETKRLRILADPSIGFEVLLTPPRFRPPIMFVGYQPGNGARDMPVREARERGYEDWPQHNDLVCGASKLAKQLRRMFGCQLLSECVAVNAIFIRWRSVTEYQRDVPRQTRDEIEVFCRAKVEDMVAAMEPKRLVVVGLDTLDRLGTRPASSGRTLTTEGWAFGRKVLATMHLSGARITTAERDLIAQRVLEFSSE